MKVLILALLLVSCGVDDQSRKPIANNLPSLPNDEAMQLIVNEFYSNANTLHMKVNYNVHTIYFVDEFAVEDIASADKPEDIIGLCHHRSSGAYIEIKKPFWDAATSQTRRTLVFHELGHCALGIRKHAPDDSGAIMEAVIIPDWLTTSNWTALVKDLFKSSPLNLIENENVIIIN